ncbi:MAG TPA: outer membrane protein transport protein [Kofleriaceae bacterium]|nr:outer membrane protein transport protein [Kofleriaceae bacterium]
MAAAAPAHAGGMTLPVHGVRDLERAGALVAGADDADALWLDPAGLANLAGDGKKALLFDVAYLYQTVGYTRVDATGAMLPKVTNQQPGSAVPTLAAALGIGDSLVIAAGLTEPYQGLHRYDVAGAQRYASVELAGSTFVTIALGAAYRVSPQLRLGATLEDDVALLDAEIVVSACPGQTPCAPGDASYDAPMTIKESAGLVPSGSIGVQYDARPELTLGAMVHAPARVSAAGTMTLALPSTAPLGGAMVQGDRATLSYTLPPSARAGVEWRPVVGLRVEAALDVELWSVQRAIDIVPSGVAVTTPGASFPVAAMHVARDYKTSLAPSLGAEYHVGVVTFGAGVAYETAAAPAGDVSVLTVDAPKLIVGLGGGYADAGWQIGAAVGLAKLSDVSVAPADARVLELEPLRAQPVPVAINAGDYQSSYLIAGIRAARRF